MAAEKNRFNEDRNFILHREKEFNFRREKNEKSNSNKMKLFNLMTSKGVVAVIVSLYDAVI